jgi:pyridoxine 4-dehydrogenase
MSTTVTAAAAGTFQIGAQRTVNRLGYGAMQLTGEGVWGEPPDRGEAIAVLRRAVDLGVNLIDTADSYGPFVSEQLIREALHPYPEDLLIATKAGLTRHGIDPKVALAEQLGELCALRDEGKIAHIGLSEVSVAQLREAQAIAPIASVQNLYNLAKRDAEPLLEVCEREQIAFIPWFPLATGRLAGGDGPLAHIAGQLGATPAQVALAWLLRRSPVMLPIPGTRSVAHLEENVRAAEIQLSDAQFAQLTQHAPPAS